VQSGYISLEAAQCDYGVAIQRNGRKLALDVEATNRLRQSRE